MAYGDLMRPINITKLSSSSVVLRVIELDFDRHINKMVRFLRFFWVEWASTWGLIQVSSFSRLNCFECWANKMPTYRLHDSTDSRHATAEEAETPFCLRFYWLTAGIRRREKREKKSAKSQSERSFRYTNVSGLCLRNPRDKSQMNNNSTLSRSLPSQKEQFGSQKRQPELPNFLPRQDAVEQTNRNREIYLHFYSPTRLHPIFTFIPLSIRAKKAGLVCATLDNNWNIKFHYPSMDLGEVCLKEVFFRMLLPFVGTYAVWCGKVECEVSFNKICCQFWRQFVEFVSLWLDKLTAVTLCLITSCKWATNVCEWKRIWMRSSERVKKVWRICWAASIAV